MLDNINNNNKDNNSNLELDRLKEILNHKINEKRNQIFPLHSMTYNNNVQYEIYGLKWVLGLTTNQRQLQMQMSQVEDLVQKQINDLKRKMTTKSIKPEKRDMFITYAETLSWILYVIHSIEEKGIDCKFTI